MTISNNNKTDRFSFSVNQISNNRHRVLHTSGYRILLRVNQIKSGVAYECSLYNDVDSMHIGYASVKFIQDKSFVCFEHRLGLFAAFTFY